MRRLAEKAIPMLLLVPLLTGLCGLDLQAQRWGGPYRNRYFRPSYRPSNRLYYGFTRPFYYQTRTRPLFYYPPKVYPRLNLPYRGYYPAGVAYSGYLGPAGPVVGNVSETYYLSSPSVYYYPEAYRPGHEVVRANYSHVLFNVTPGSALIYLDDKLIGSARSFANEREKYQILEGEYRLRIENPGFEPFDSVLQVQADQTIHLDVSLQSRRK